MTENKITVGPWGTDENHSVTVEHTVHELTTPDGFTHPYGMHKVTAKHTLSGKAWKGKCYNGRTRTFKGETAWMQAERLFNDIVLEVQYS